MSGINKVIILGNLGVDPKSAVTQTGMTICNLSVATSKKWTDKQTGECKEKVEWHRIVTFDKWADAALQYLKKGSKIYVEGSLQTRSWDDKEGAKQYCTEIVADKIEYLDKKSDANDSSSTNKTSDNNNTPDFDDAIPF